LRTASVFQFILHLYIERRGNAE